MSMSPAFARIIHRIERKEYDKAEALIKSYVRHVVQKETDYLKAYVGQLVRGELP